MKKANIFNNCKVVANSDKKYGVYKSSNGFKVKESNINISSYVNNATVSLK